MRARFIRRACASCLPNSGGRVFSVSRIFAVSFFLLIASAFSVMAQSLTTTFAGGNGQNGNMFDVDVLASPITITAFDIHNRFPGQQTVQIWYRAGSYTASPNSSAGWTLHATVAVAANGDGQATNVPIPPLALNANQNYGFYINSTGNLRYTSGTALGAVYVSDANLRIRQGIGKAANFGTSWSPRIWNGTIYYTVVIPPQADAGLDQTVLSGANVQLDGTASQPAGQVSYSWTQLSGTPVALTGVTTAQPSFTAAQPANGAVSETLVFQLTVTDASGQTSTDTVQITVMAVAVLSANKSVMVFSEDGSDCSDPTASSPDVPENPAAIPGACIEYTIAVQNTGPVPAQAVNLTDALPTSLTLVDAFRSGWIETAPAPDSFAFNAGCSGGSCNVEVQNGIVPANATATITIRATIN